MRFPLLFTRRKGAGDGTPLGSDAAPTTYPKGRTMADNTLSITHYAANSPARKIAIGYTAPSGTTPLTCNAYAWDETSTAFYRVGAADVALTPGTITTIDLPSLVERAPLAHELGGAAAHHHIIAIVVADAVGAADGVHTFAVGLAT